MFLTTLNLQGKWMNKFDMNMTLYYYKYTSLLLLLLGNS